jgi:hypothetical protein
MADQPGNLMLEHLKELQATQAQILAELKAIDRRITLTDATVADLSDGVAALRVEITTGRTDAQRPGPAKA